MCFSQDFHLNQEFCFHFLHFALCQFIAVSDLTVEPAETATWLQLRKLQPGV